MLQEYSYDGLSAVRLQGGGLFIFNFAQLLEDLIKGLLKRRLRVARLAEPFYQLHQFVIANGYFPTVLDTRRVQQALYFVRCLLNRGLSTLQCGIYPSFLLWGAIARYSSSGHVQLRTTSFNICLPYNICILGGSSRCFLGFFQMVQSLRLGAASALGFHQ